VNFEYHLKHMRLFGRRLDMVEIELNTLAKEGWVLCQVCGLHGEIFIFRREINQGQARQRAQNPG
jgi:hypothetical protein